MNQNAGLKTHSNSILVTQNHFGTREDETDVQRFVGGMPLIEDFCLAMRTNPLALIRGVSEFVTVIYNQAVNFKQETKPLAKTLRVKLKDDAHQPDELKSHLKVMKTYLRVRYILSEYLERREMTV